jgi:hypothetical protein
MTTPGSVRELIVHTRRSWRVIEMVTHVVRRVFMMNTHGGLASAGQV